MFTINLVKRSIYSNIIRNSFSQKKTFLIQTLKEKDLDQCTEGLANCFAQIQVVKSLNINQQLLRPFMRNIAEIGIKRQLSIKAVDESNGKIAGCYLNFDTVDQHQFQTDKLDPSFKPLFSLLHDLTHDYLQKRDAFKQHNLWAHVWIVGVFKQYQGNRLTKRMLDHTLKVFKQKGYKNSCIQLASPLTQKVFLNSTNYYNEVKRINYNQYIYEGKKVMPQARQFVSFACCDLNSINIV